MREFSIQRFADSLPVLLIVLLLPAQSALAWGKLGHEIVASTAARVLAAKRGRVYLRTHEYDLGYYANVPDMIWRNLSEAIGKREAPEHFIEWNYTVEEIFQAPEHLPEEFAEYHRTMGDKFDPALGFSPWRIQELTARCKQLTANFNRDNQGPLLVCLGVLSHYTGDLAQPLHASDNYDGQLTNQPGIHSYFESDMVTELEPELRAAVLKKALARYEGLKRSPLKSAQAIRRLIGDSHSMVPELLAIDRSIQRERAAEASRRFRDLVIARLAEGAAVTALIWDEILVDVHSFDSNKFYFFDGRPEYVEPGDRSPLP